jgi:membrane-bound lytic murein transglycosylase D
MRFLHPRKPIKTFNIRQIGVILWVISALLLSACGSAPRSDGSAATSPPGSHTPRKTVKKQADTAPAARRYTSRGALADIFSTTSDGSDGDRIVPYAAEYDSLWQRLRKGLALGQGRDNAAITSELNWYRQHPTFLYRATERSERYLHYVVSAVEQRNMPMELALLPIVESTFDPFAYSRSGAAGIWQFIPATGRHFGLEQNWWYDGRKDVVASTDAALNYLQYLHDKFDGDWLVAIAAYNFGEGNVGKAIAENRRRGRPTDFWSLSLREETRTYVPKLLALSRLVQAPQKYGVNLHAIPDRAYFAVVETRGQMELSRAAAMAGVEEEEIRHLNPGFHHGATDPSGPHRLLVPVNTVERFRRQLAQAPATKAAPPLRHNVAKGDTLSAIARRYGVSVAALQRANGISDSNIRPGQALVIPGAAIATTGAGSSPTLPYGSQQLFHTVQTGDTPRRIATRYGVTPEDVLRWNGMRPQDPVKLGQRLSIWTQPARAAAGDGRKFGYTVQRGDSLYAIANRFKVQVNDIVRWNQMNGHQLQAGQKLTLYLAETARLN